MIENQVLKEIMGDFYNGPDQEMMVISAEERDEFWQWVANAGTLMTIDSEQPPRINDEKFGSQCYGNSQIETVNKNVYYYEGFTKINNHFIYHAYNVSENHVVDVTANKYFLDEIAGLLPVNYYGINIPIAFILELNGRSVERNEINIRPLLKLYWNRVRN
jgi:hypothetical protein